MKKAAFIFAIFYLLNAVGYGIEVHSCLGRISDVNYAFFDTSCACESDHSEEFKMPCCEDQSFFVQLEDEHQQAEKLTLSYIPSKFDYESKSFSTSLVNSILEDNQTLRAPPIPIDRITIYQSFIFYA